MVSGGLLSETVRKPVPGESMSFSIFEEFSSSKPIPDIEI